MTESKQRELTYLACPYTDDDPAVRELRFRKSAEAAAALMRRGVLVFSPITHSHPMAAEGGLPGGWEFWREYDERMLASCDTLTILTLDGWGESRGVKGEVAIACEQGKQCFLMTPETWERTGPHYWL